MLTSEQYEDLREWLRERPPAIQQLATEFPPGCRVRAVPSEELVCPAPGEVGMVFSYVESSGSPCVRVAVEGNPYAGACAPEWLEIVGFGDVQRSDVEQAMAEIRGQRH